MHDRWLIYGANGFTGRLCAKEAASRGLTPVLAGRSEGPVRALAESLSLEWRTFSLDQASIRPALEDVALVLHCAGPFSTTHAPMIDACIAARAHYLDVTGELLVLESIYGRHEALEAAKVTAIPAIGFDVVPTDCVAATLAERLAGATKLELAFASTGRPSKGTKKSTVEGLQRPGVIRKGGLLADVPAAWATKEVDFADKRRTCVSIPWGDVSSAYRSTGIGDIVVYMAMPANQIRAIRLARPLMGLLRVPALQRLLERRVEAGDAGPDDQAMARAKSYIWGRVETADGRSAQMQIRTPNGYLLTANSAVEAARRLLEGGVAFGALTPAQAFGAGYVFDLNGVQEVTS